MTDEMRHYELCDVPAELQSAALELFNGNEQAATSWLNKPSRALGKALPAQVACTSAAGLQQTIDVIKRIEHGVFQ